MKLVTTALEWSYAAGETDVRAEMLEQAAALLVLRRNTLRIIDGAGPSIDASPSGATTDAPDQALVPPSIQTTSRDEVGDSAQPAKAARCSFTEVIPIDVQAFQSSGIRLVECPTCAATRTLEPHHSVLRFTSHDKRKMRLPPTARRWARWEAIWKVVGE